MMTLVHMEFKLEDRIGGQPLMADNVGLPLLREFLTEVEAFIKGDDSQANLADSIVRVESGSLKIVVLATSVIAASVAADVQSLNVRGDLDAIQPKRAAIVEKWQSRAERNPDRTYTVAPDSQVSAKISKNSKFTHQNEMVWVEVKKYLTGQVVDLGGKQSPNIHLVLSDTGDSLRIDATSEQLSAETENHLYKVVTLRVRAEQHLQNKRLRKIKLLDFVSLGDQVDERALASLWEKGQQAWKDVSSAVKWVEQLRGNS